MEKFLSLCLVVLIHVYVYDRQQRNERVLNVTDMCVYMYNCLFVNEMHDCDVCVPEAIGEYHCNFQLNTFKK